MVCPLCGIRRARRGCPALSKQICAVCCGTKRLVQISCPSDCTWLASARENPPAVVVRQQQHDIGLVVRFMRGFTERQSRLFFLIAAFLARYQAPELYAPTDDDIAEATASMAATFETASRGLIYDHRPASVLAERLTSALKPLLSEAGKGGGSAFEREAATVLRRIEESVRDLRAVEPTNRQAFLELLRRITADDPASEGPVEASRLIVP